MPVPDGYIDVFYGISVQGDSDLMGVTMGWAVGDIPTEEELLGHYNRWVALVRPRLNTTLSFPLCRASAGTLSGDYTLEVAPDPVLAGTAGTAPLPNNCAVLVAKISTSGGRRNRGRMYIPCPAETAVDGAGVLSTGERGAWQTAMNAWIEGEFTAGWGSPAILHQTPPYAPTTITNLVVRSKIATQRRRMRS